MFSSTVNMRLCRLRLCRPACNGNPPTSQRKRKYAHKYGHVIHGRRYRCLIFHMRELVDAATPGPHDTWDAVSPVPHRTRDRDQVIGSRHTDRVREEDIVVTASRGRHDTRDAVSTVQFPTALGMEIRSSCTRYRTDRVRETDLMDARHAKWVREVATFPECTRPCSHHQILLSVSRGVNAGKFCT